ncbi:MAG: hypothetical protein HQK50_11430 [Oligoflexia bacterium]|nr:hypothetical protein [Oligoflexia bacterium]
MHCGLVIEREGKIYTVVEIKFHERPSGVEVAIEVDLKLKKLIFPRGATVEKMLVTLYGMDDHLKALSYFDHTLCLDDFFDSRKVE